MVQKRKASSRKTSTRKSTTRRRVKRDTTKSRKKRIVRKRVVRKTGRKTKTLSKKYNFFDRKNRFSDAKAPSRSMQPPNRQSVSASPADIASSSIKQFEMKYAKPDNSKALVLHDKNHKRAYDRFKTATHKVEKNVKHFIGESGKAVDEFGKWSESVAPGLTALAAANPEMPLLGVAAGVVDTSAMAHRTYHGMIEQTPMPNLIEDDRKKPPRDIGMKHLTDTNKYQKVIMDLPRGTMPEYTALGIDPMPIDDDL